MSQDSLNDDKLLNEFMDRWEAEQRNLNEFNSRQQDWESSDQVFSQQFGSLNIEHASTSNDCFSSSYPSSKRQRTG